MQTVKMDINFFFCFIYICDFFVAIAYVLIGNGLYDEAIRHFSTMLQVSFLFGPLKITLVKLYIKT